MVLLLPSFAHHEAQAQRGSAVDPTKVEEALKRLTLQQKVGQLLIIGFNGTDVNTRLKNMIQNYHPGAVIVFKRNIVTPVQISHLNGEAQRLAHKDTQLPLLIMVDQEGGSVTRIHTDPAPPSALTVGMADDPKLAEGLGVLTGKILNLLGFNMNLAPVVDLSDPYERNFIGNRSFGPDPARVKELAYHYANGLLESRVLPTIKHFPGHGGILQDSHKILPKKMDSLEALLKHDLVPFSHIAQSGLSSAFMVAHVAYPNIDESRTPATYSYKLVTEILKEQLGYKGLIMTDDLEMTGANFAGDVGERAVRAFEAGNDMMMVAWNSSNQIKAFNALLAAVKSGRISKERLDESLRKILAIKLDIKNQNRSLLPQKQIMAQLKKFTDEMRELTHKTVQTNFDRALRGYSFLEGTLDPERPLIVFSADREFYNLIKKSAKNPVQFVHMKKGKAARVDLKMASQPEALGIFYASGIGTVKKLIPVYAQTKSRIIVVNTTHPGTIENTHQYLAVLNVNSTNSMTGQWLMDFLREREQLPTELREPAEEKQGKFQRQRRKKTSSFIAPATRRQALSDEAYLMRRQKTK